MMRASNEIRIEKNNICYADTNIRVSQITRTYIVKLFNYRKKQYQDRLKQYNDKKLIYESVEKSKKKMRIKTYTVFLLICLLISVFLFQRYEPDSVLGKAALILMGLAIIFGIATFMAARKEIKYSVSPPTEDAFPDSHGLFIEMSSGRSELFIAEDDTGKESLRALQMKINNADTLSEPVTVNMIENHISVENNDGIVSLGDHAVNTVKEEETMNI